MTCATGVAQTPAGRRSRTSLPGGPARLRAAVALCLAPAALGAQGEAPSPRVTPIPEIDWGWEMLDVLAQRQQIAAREVAVDHDFRFTDRLAESGIRFVHVSTADSGKLYKPNHYDHGNGVAVADVDGDGLYDVYFSSQHGRNELWKNLGGGRFEDVTDRAGVGLDERISVAASFADVDNDGDPDLYVTTVKMGNALFLNDGEGRFEDVTRRAGLAHRGHSSGALFFDYDNDGWLDLFVTNVGVYTTDQFGPGGYYLGIGPDGEGPDAFSGHLVPERTERSLLYRNLGRGRFEEVSEAAGLLDGSWSGDAAFADLNGDGFSDLYVLNMQGDDHYWENVEGRRFVDRTAERFPKTPWGAMGIKFFDHNNDGRLDLVLTDMHSDMSRKVTPGLEKLKSLMRWSEETLQGGENNLFGNAFYENLGDGKFREASDELGTENYWPWGLSVGDLNADGWQDIFIASSMNFPYRYGVNSALLNLEGRGFLDSEFLLGIEPRSGVADKPWYRPDVPWLATKKPWFEVDCSGADRGHPLCRGTGQASVWGSLGTRSSAIFDLDGDGDLDIVTNEFNDSPQLLVSDLSERRPVNHLRVELTGTASNRDGLGALVTVHAGSKVLTQQHDGKSGYLSQSSLPLYFGLGSESEIDRVEVVWPSGRRQTVTEGLAVGELLVVVEEPA